MALPRALQFCKDAGFLVNAKERGEFVSKLVIRFNGTSTPGPMGLDRKLIRLQHEYADIDALLPDEVVTYKPARKRPIVRFDPKYRYKSVNSLTVSQRGIPVMPRTGLGADENYEAFLPEEDIRYFASLLRMEWGPNIQMDRRIEDALVFFGHTPELRNALRLAKLSEAVHATRMEPVGISRILGLPDNYIDDRLEDRELPTDGIVLMVRGLADGLDREAEEYAHYFDRSPPLEMLSEPDVKANAFCEAYGTPERFFLVGHQTPVTGRHMTKSGSSWTREAIAALVERIKVLRKGPATVMVSK